MAAKDFLKIGDAAAAIGVTTQTLRYYEELGLLEPHRTGGGTRLYAPADVDRLKTIHRLVHLDTPLATLGKLAQARKSSPTGDLASRQVHEMLAAAAAKVRERLASLQALDRELQAAMGLVGECFGCTKPPTAEGCRGCPVAEKPRPPVLRDIVWPDGG